MQSTAPMDVMLAEVDKHLLTANRLDLGFRKQGFKDWINQASGQGAGALHRVAKRPGGKDEPLLPREDPFDVVAHKRSHWDRVWRCQEVDHANLLKAMRQKLEDEWGVGPSHAGRPRR